MEATRYPLSWPAGRPRQQSRSRSRFKVASFGLPAHTPTDKVIERYRIMARDHHPDRNDGDDSLAKQVNAAYEAFKRERGL